MGLIMNGNCLRVSSYFGRNRIFAVYYYMWWIRLSLWRMCWNCYYVCYCIVWMLVSLSHSCYIVAARVKLLPLLLHSYYYYHRSDSFIFFGQSEYIMLYNIIYELHRINLCHLHHLDFTVYTHTPMHTQKHIALPYIMLLLLFFL